MNNYSIHTGFTGLEDYRKFIRRQYYSEHNQRTLDRLKEKMPSNVNKGWYGKDVTLEEMQSTILQFKNPNLIDEIYNKVKDNLPESIANKLKEHKLNFNDREIGVFSMDRFMMNMFFKPAFFNKKSNQYVPPHLVYQKENEYFYKLDNSPCVMEKKLATNNKKVYAYFPEIPKNSNAIEMLVVAGANANVTAEQMLYTGIVSIVVAELCQKANIKIKIDIAIGSKHNDMLNFAIVPMKDFNTPIDKNIIAMLTSDARVFRSEMFTGIVANYNQSGQDCPDGLGSLISVRDLKELFKDKNLFNKYFKTEKVFFTSGIFDERTAIESIGNIIKNIDNDE